MAKNQMQVGIEGEYYCQLKEDKMEKKYAQYQNVMAHMNDYNWTNIYNDQNAHYPSKPIISNMAS